MIAEFAVEPEVMAEWKHFHSLHDDFGIGQGRLLCQFPSKWRKEVLQAAQRMESEGINSALQTQRILDQFQHGSLRRGLVASNREYNAQGNWIESARTHPMPFDAIIHAGTPSTGRELQAGEFLKSDPLYRRSRQCEIQRVADQLIDAGWAGFRRAKEIYVIDPYFNPVVAKFGEVLGRFLTRLERNGSELRRLEVHTNLPEEYRPDTQKRHWQSWAESHLPSGWRLKIVHWQALETGGRMHARYILTDIGGLDYNWGTDEGPQEYTQVSLLDDSFWEKLYQRFCWCDENMPKVLRDVPDRIFQIIG